MHRHYPQTAKQSDNIAALNGMFRFRHKAQALYIEYVGSSNIQNATIPTLKVKHLTFTGSRNFGNVSLFHRQHGVFFAPKPRRAWRPFRSMLLARRGTTGMPWSLDGARQRDVATVFFVFLFYFVKVKKKLLLSLQFSF